jgi:hypothetical protein
MRALWKRRDGVPPMINDDGRSMPRHHGGAGPERAHLGARRYSAVFTLMDYPATPLAMVPED